LSQAPALFALAILSYFCPRLTSDLDPMYASLWLGSQARTTAPLSLYMYT
jgi:hypothetical protein